MAKIVLNDVGNFNSTGLATLNNNWDLIAAALETFLSRDGTSPNSMTSDIDLNDNDLLNVGSVDCETLTLNGEVFDGTAPTWVVGSGAPSSGTGDNGDMYLDGSSGDIYGPKASGAWPASAYTITGATGDTGSTGLTGATGDKGWAPVFSIQNNGAVRVLRLDDWVGGEGTKPATGTYVGTTGLVAAIGDAVDIRGPQGPEGAAGAGTGDMLAATYDPGAVAGDAFDMENMTEGTNNKIFSAAERTKLSGIASSATANSSDATLLARANHTGTQTASTISDFSTAADARVAAAVDSTVQAYDAQLSSLVRQNSKSAAYTLVLGDGGKHILHPSADTTARIFTIPANASVAFPIGTAVTFVNQNGAGVITISITSDTMRLAGDGTTGSRTLAANGIATALKITSTEWIISGTGLT